MKDEPFVSVIISTYTRRDMLEGCLESLSRQTYPKDRYEVIVVDDESKDNTLEFLKEYETKTPLNFKWLTQKNKKMGAARNLGVEHSKGEIICFTDDDCLADKEWITELVRGYADEDIACVGGPIISHEPTTIAEIYSDRKNLLVQNFLSCGAVITSNTSYRRRAFLEVNGFDEMMPPAEDGDLGLRVKLEGHKFIYATKAIVYHRHRANLKALLKQQYGHAVGVTRLHKKYPHYFKPIYTLLPIPAKIVYWSVTYPLKILKAPFIKERRYYLTEPLLDILVSTCQFAGVLNEALIGDPYKGKKYDVIFEFLPEQGIGTFIGKITSKIVRTKK